MNMDWLLAGGISFVIYAAIFIYCITKRRWTQSAIWVGLVNMALVGFHLVAPIRGALDPGYLGYSFGFIQVEAGIMVTLVTGLILLAALASACVAVLNARGRPMILLVLLDLLFAVNVSFMLIYGILTDANGFSIQLGEFLTIPSLVSFLILLFVLAVPLWLSVYWGLKRLNPVTSSQDETSSA